MKKILQLIVAALITFNAAESKAQITNGNLSSDWTFTDLNGVTQNLYTYLNAGKTVIIDISAAWCHPCWLYHTGVTSGVGGVSALDAIWSAHGPAGATGVSASTTDDMMVFLVEGELTNTTAQLHGITGTTGNAYADDTQGDWTAGTNYPIIDLSSATSGANTFLSSYNLHYFPTCIMICPDRSMTEVDQWTAAQLYTQKGNCSSATASSDAEMMNSTVLNNLASCDSVTPTFRLGNVGTSTLTSATITYQVDGVTQKVYNWTGSLATYANATVTGIKVGSSVSGNHTVTAIVSNPNGGADPTSSNNTTGVPFTIYPSTGGAFVSESFESGLPSSFIFTNGLDGSYWDLASTGYSSSASATEAFSQIAAGNVDIMTLPPMSFASATAPELTFDVSYAQVDASVNDALQVSVSTNCGASWTVRYSKSGATLATHAVVSTVEYVPSGPADWRHETVNLSLVAGQSDVLVRFKGTSAQGNDLYVDNINIVGTTAGIKENEIVNNVNVYPNPMTNSANVNFELIDASNVSMVMVNTLGQIVLNQDLGKMPAGVQNYSLDASSLSNGLYFLNIKVGNSMVTKKISINK